MLGDGNHLRWAEHFVRIKGGGVLDVEQYGKIVSVTYRKGNSAFDPYR